MKCDRCNNDATVHEVMIEGGKQVEKHLCEHCAVDEGVSPTGGSQITQIITQYIAAGQGGARKARAVASCSKCGLTYAKFRQGGLLGCEHCYETFAEQLGPLIRRAHEGGMHHVGKVPCRIARGLAQRTNNPDPAPGRIVDTPAEESACFEEQVSALREKVQSLRQRLSDAVSAEQYERAAKLRDELKSLNEMLASHGGVGGGGGGGGGESVGDE